MNPMGLRRNLMNIVHNYSDAQIKVREATSNDPWGPSSTVMSEIADLTYNVVAFSEIMQMIWKRLNDHGKNWRHVYKSLVLLEYLIKTGTEKVAQQCKENIFAIQTLRDFQYTEDNKDQGMNVREKAKQLVNLLKDDERLKNERARALKAKERFAQASAGIGSDMPYSTSGSFREQDDNMGSPRSLGDRRVSSDLECARPQTAGEEELQLQLALAMSKEEAEQEEQKKRSDDVRLQMAITQSEEDFKVYQVPEQVQPPNRRSQNHHSSLVDLLDMDMPGANHAQPDPWGGGATAAVPVINDPWKGSSLPHGVPPGAVHVMPAVTSDPWALTPPVGSRPTPPAAALQGGAGDPWNANPVNDKPTDPWGIPAPPQNYDRNKLTSSPFDILEHAGRNSLGVSPPGGGAMASFDPLLCGGLGPSPKKTPESFLGENSSLVNLDALVSSSNKSQPIQQQIDVINPFATNGLTGVPAPNNTPNMFPPQQPARLSLNQMRTQQQFGSATNVTQLPGPQPGLTIQPGFQPQAGIGVGGGQFAPPGAFGFQQQTLNNTSTATGNPFL